MVHCKQFRQVELYWYTVNLNNPTHKRLSESFAEVNFAFVKFCNCSPKNKIKQKKIVPENCLELKNRSDPV